MGNCHPEKTNVDRGVGVKCTYFVTICYSALIKRGIQKSDLCTALGGGNSRDGTGRFFVSSEGPLHVLTEF